MTEQRAKSNEQREQLRSPLKDENENEDERLKAAEQRLIATGSQVNVAEQRLKDTQSQGYD